MQSRTSAKILLFCKRLQLSRLKHSVNSIIFAGYKPVNYRHIKLISDVDEGKYINGPFQKVLPAEVLLELIQHLKQLKWTRKTLWDSQNKRTKCQDYHLTILSGNCPSEWGQKHQKSRFLETVLLSDIKRPWSTQCAVEGKNPSRKQ